MTARVVFEESLQKETAPLGVKAVVFEVGAVETGVCTIRQADNKGFANFSTNPKYRGLADDFCAKFVSMVLVNCPSDTERLPGAVWNVVIGQCRAADRPFSVRGPAGAYSLAIMRQK
ncbi:hypothetical protein CaCOL14_002094 [Colletotrichum acutatum]|uniref:Uncharacterized protein n=1 Tax=Glomerella acutata TaxID=27357 RepID=A0AAD8UB83_GLOAC|nr:uncharacterized protein BDZ83DRAFT_655295 [Colletotrichum acutatum]KAK1717455.1 hypothetical protein BDZ83DRAFT_655295 [Colletotrichum acutatum]